MAQPQLYDKSGKPLSLTGDAADQAVASGEAGFLQGQKVHVVTPKGQVGTIPAEQAQKALSQGMRLATDDEVHHAQVQAKYGGIGGQAMTAMLGALSGASYGVTDEAVSALGGRHYIEEHREANPLTWTGSQVAGAIAPAFLGDEAALAGLGKTAEEAGEAAEGASALAKAGQAAKAAISAPTRLVSRAGQATENVVRSVLGAEGEGSVITGLARKALTKGAGSAAEGALIGGAQQIDEDTLGDHELNGEKVLAAMGHGALLGLGAGAGLSAAGEISSRVLGRASPTLARMSEEQAARLGASPTAPLSRALRRDLEALPGGVQGAGRQLLDDGVPGFAHTTEDLTPRLEQAAQKADARVHAFMETADRAGAAGPDVEKMFQLAKNDETATAALEAVTGVPSIGRAVQEGLDRDAMIFGAKLPLADAANLAKAPALRGVFDAEIQRAADQAAKDLGGSALEEYESAKLAQSRYDAFTKELDRRSEHAADEGHGTLGAAALGLITHGVHGVLAGLVYGAVKKAVQERGSSTAAVILDKLSALRGIERASRHVDTQIDRGIAGFFREKGRAPVRVREAIEGEAGEHAADTTARKVMDAASNPDMHAGVVETAASPIAPHAPKTANSFQRASLRGTMFLAQAAPKPHAPPSITPQFDSRVQATSDAQRSDYMRQAQAVHDPMTVMRDMGNGSVTPSQVRALKTVYPALYEDIVSRVHAKLADLKKPLSYQQKVALSTLLGIPADETLSPQFVTAMQLSFAQPPANTNAAPSKPHRQEKTQRPLKGDIAKDVDLSIGPEKA